jgi:hypothetical protein
VETTAPRQVPAFRRRAWRGGWQVGRHASSSRPKAVEVRPHWSRLPRSSRNCRSVSLARCQIGVASRDPHGRAAPAVRVGSPLGVHLRIRPPPTAPVCLGKLRAASVTPARPPFHSRWPESGRTSRLSRFVPRTGRYSDQFGGQTPGGPCGTTVSPKRAVGRGQEAAFRRPKRQRSLALTPAKSPPPSRDTISRWERFVSLSPTRLAVRDLPVR